MKKIIRIICLCLCVALCAPLTVGCGGGGGNSGNTVVIRAYQAGYGSDVYDAFQAAWNKKADAGEKDFYIKIIGDPVLSTGFMATMNSVSYGIPNNLADIYIVDTIASYGLSRMKYTEGPCNGQYFIVDLTDVWTDAKYAYDGKTIAEKVDPVMAKNLRIDRVTGEVSENGSYAFLPYSNGATGFVYYKSYLEEYATELKNLGSKQFDENGKFIEPQTMQEFWTLEKHISQLSRNQISEDNMVYTIANDIQNASGYLLYMSNSFLMQMLGEEDFYKYINFDGVNDVDSMYANFDKVDYAYKAMYENVYKTGGDPSKKNMTNFKNFDNPTLTWNGMFIQRKAFFTINGDWSITEASGQMAKDDVMGIMPIPLACDVDSGLVIAKATKKSEADIVDGNDYDGYFKIAIDKVDEDVIPDGEESDDYIYFAKAMSSRRAIVGAIIPTASSKAEMAKEVIAWLYSNEAANMFTKTTGSIQPFNYEIDASIYNELTDFSKAAIKMNKTCLLADTTTGTYTSTQLRGIFSTDGGMSDRWIYNIFANVKNNDLTHTAMMAARKNANVAAANDILGRIDLYELTVKNNNW